MLSLCIGKGVGKCSPRDLCEIWPSVPDSDRRLHGFQWYEVADGSGTEYLVLHVAGTADYTTSETDNWWVRLERTESELSITSVEGQLWGTDYMRAH